MLPDRDSAFYLPTIGAAGDFFGQDTSGWEVLLKPQSLENACGTHARSPPLFGFVISNGDLP